MQSLFLPCANVCGFSLNHSKSNAFSELLVVRVIFFSNKTVSLLTGLKQCLGLSNHNVLAKRVASYFNSIPSQRKLTKNERKETV